MEPDSTHIGRVLGAPAQEAAWIIEVETFPVLSLELRCKGWVTDQHVAVGTRLPIEDDRFRATRTRATDDGDDDQRETSA
jgi:hypothetical protein